ncbi:Nonribosomal peptide synthetase vlms [Frankliniella fusca]|uniref:Nonribosomal peptide synthetase vlms n=1 Tax=Frankliniella fusca TaxID=407009 RepID=A0AAE1HDS7_9NEOP|nr:Nonribosomal peptide synthetase vlms [Frankliniella fusca]
MRDQRVRHLKNKHDSLITKARLLFEWTSLWLYKKHSNSVSVVPKRQHEDIPRSVVGLSNGPLHGAASAGVAGNHLPKPAIRLRLVAIPLEVAKREKRRSFRSHMPKLPKEKAKTQTGLERTKEAGPTKALNRGQIVAR